MTTEIIRNADIVLLKKTYNQINVKDAVKVNSKIKLTENFHWKIPWFLLLLDAAQITLYLMDKNIVVQNLIFMAHKSTQIWRFITYMLLHSNTLHLIMNISLQTLIGFWLENEQSPIKVAIIYINGVISGSIATLILQPQYALMGGSAGVYALLTSHIPHLLKNFNRLSNRYMRVISLIILLCSDLSFTVLHVTFNNNTRPRISFVAHISGAFSGFIGGFLFYTTFDKQFSYKYTHVYILYNTV